jgi:L-methionine (R)-S-oxide reductase
MSHAPAAIEAASATDFHRQLHHRLEAVLAGERDWICNLAQTAALLMELMPDLNWAGFYLLQQDTLVLGPFQGRVACTRIPLHRGVCGAAATRRATVIVPDVHAFPDHIACDSRSRSEIVVPILHQDRLLGVLDLDSPRPARFTEDDARGLEGVVARLLQASDPPDYPS